MLRQIAVAMLALSLGTPALAEDFNPLKIARDAAEFGLDTAKKAVDLGLETAEEAGDVAEDALTFEDDCPKGEYYKDRDGRMHKCD